MIERQEMQLQDPIERIHNFNEVALGFDFNQVKIEASRCLQCKQPRCVKACPVNINIPKFIHQIVNDKLDEAYATIYKDNILPSICGRVCPQENQCEGSCILGIKSKPVAIGALERFLGDRALQNKSHTNENIPSLPMKVAIVGSGPAGLAFAATIRRFGYQTDIYEALHDYGGVLRYGIPEFRLPKNIVNQEIECLKQLGVRFFKNNVIGKTLTIKQLQDEENYQAIFIASGAGLPRALNIPGENYNGIYYANEFLTRVNLMKAYQFPNEPTPVKIGKHVCVIGGGNVAMDAARVAKRLGAETVTIIYRRDMSGLPARLEEVHHAIEEGITFKLLSNPVEFYDQEYEVHAIKIEKMKLGNPDQSGRKRPIPTGEYETIPTNHVIIAIGQTPNPIIKASTDKLEVDQKGLIKVNDYQTSISGVYAGGDIVTGAATVIRAMGAGKNAAKTVHKNLCNQSK